MDISKVRNSSIIAHIDHGKTTLADHLLGSGGMLPEQMLGTARALDDLEEEQKRGITIESSVASMEIPYSKNDTFLLNLIDTPGHLDFSGKVAEALRMVDGSLILVDAVEGVMAQTVTVLRQAMREFIQPVLAINKIDRLITELQLPIKEIQKRIQQIVVEVRNLCKKQEFKGLKLPNFQDGSVVLMSAIDGWGLDAQAHEEHQLTMEKVMEYYNTGNVDELSDKVPLSLIIARSIYNCLPDPITAAMYKYPKLFTSAVPDETMEYLLHCDPKSPTILLVGKFLQISRSGKLAVLVKIASGTIKKGVHLYSSRTGEKMRVTRIVIIRGSKIIETQELSAGNVGAAIITPSPFPGDVITYDPSVKLIGRNIGYVQEPVVSISIEPKKIRDMTRLHNLLEERTESTPGLLYFNDKDTGEMKVLGVGTLQLELLVMDIEKSGIKVDTSDPIVLKFEMPTYNSEFEVSKWQGMFVHAGETQSMRIQGDVRHLYEDSSNNNLYIHSKHSFSGEGLDGLVEVFRQGMRVSPIHGKHVRNLTVILSEKFMSSAVKTYEYGIIVGYAVVRESLNNCGVKVHAPYYNIDIIVPDDYVGVMIQEVQKFDVTIQSIESDGFLSTINAVVFLGVASKLSDSIRSVSDGNAFYSFTGVTFLPERES